MYANAPYVRLVPREANVNVDRTQLMLGQSPEVPPPSWARAGSPEMTSRSSMSFRPSRKSSSMFSICVPALRRWELHQAVNV